MLGRRLLRLPQSAEPDVRIRPFCLILIKMETEFISQMRRLNYSSTEAYAKVSNVVKILFRESFFCRPGTVGDRFAGVSGVIYRGKTQPGQASGAGGFRGFTDHQRGGQSNLIRAAFGSPFFDPVE
jgi:hypothetical protein